METHREDKDRRAKRPDTGSAETAVIRIARRDSLTRTKAVLNAALRLWELKQRTHPERSVLGIQRDA
jgi:hypothetical protein